VQISKTRRLTYFREIMRPWALVAESWKNQKRHDMPRHFCIFRKVAHVGRRNVSEILHEAGSR